MVHFFSISSQYWRRSIKSGQVVWCISGSERYKDVWAHGMGKIPIIWAPKMMGTSIYIYISLQYIYISSIYIYISSIYIYIYYTMYILCIYTMYIYYVYILCIYTMYIYIYYVYIYTMYIYVNIGWVNSMIMWYLVISWDEIETDWDSLVGWASGPDLWRFVEGRRYHNHGNNRLFVCLL